MKRATLPLSIIRHLLPLLLSIGLVLPAFAHRIQVFAYTSGGEIIVETSVGNNRPVNGSEVIVTSDSKGDILLQGQTDTQGMFKFLRPELSPNESLLITVNTGQGHQGSWTMTPKDLGQHQAPGRQDTTQALATGPLNRGEPSLSPEVQQQLTELVARAVAHEIEPLKLMLAKQLNKRPSLQEIIGGIGWLVGIGGLLAALKKRQ